MQFEKPHDALQTLVVLGGNLALTPSDSTPRDARAFWTAAFYVCSKPDVRAVGALLEVLEPSLVRALDSGTLDTLAREHDVDEATVRRLGYALQRWSEYARHERQVSWLLDALEELASSKLHTPLATRAWTNYLVRVRARDLRTQLDAVHYRWRVAAPRDLVQDYVKVRRVV